MKISIDPIILKKTPNFRVGVMTFDVLVENASKVDDLVSFWEDKISKEIAIENVVKLDVIIDGRNAYKAYGKDPSRYRLAVESLYRRLSKGNRLYRINNVVDLGNILSLKTRKSIAVLDFNQIKGDVIIRLGTEEDEYYGIGRGKINIKNIPLYEDSIGPFGSVTSDTNRTMITNDTTKVLLFLISFSGDGYLPKEMEFTQSIYEKYARGTNFDKYVL